MKILQLQILAILQGMTEFLPVSSSGHLALLQRLFGIEENQFGPLLEVFLHAATLLSVILFFRKRISALLKGLLHRDKATLHDCEMLLLSAVPAGILYFCAHDTIEKAFGNPHIIGVFMLVTGLFLYSLKYLKGLNLDFSNKSPNWKQTLLIGLAQAIAILPGISRSCSTYTAARWLKIDSQKAFDFSFLMSIPVVGGAILLKLRHFSELTSAIPWPALLCACIISACVGYSSLVILSLFRLTGKIHIFSYWMFAMFLLTLFLF